MIKLSSLKLHPDNPRLIKDDSFHKLCESLKTFPEMMAKREIIIDTWTNPIILCGNQRYKALKEIGYKEIPDKWIKTAEDLTDDQKKELMIKDNVQAGDWDIDLLKDWNQDKLINWGIDVEENTPHRKEEIILKPYKKHHVLISYNPENHLIISELIDKLLSENIDIEIESQSN